MAQNFQGGKLYGQLKSSQEIELNDVNQQFLTSGDWDDIDDLDLKLDSYKLQFLEFDENNSGDIDLMELKRMMEKLGQAKTHLQLKKMIEEIDTNNSGTIHYHEFLTMMLGKRNSILKKILMFETLKKEKEKPIGVAPRKSLNELP